MNQLSQPTSTQIRPILQFSANQSILSKSQRHPILRRKVAKAQAAELVQSPELVRCRLEYTSDALP
ncbi:MAG TPA: hypothetical protein VN803_10095, partial [Gemmatimonadales bacterium]|nr:hypothetical protein [Gemmatimonadales bacterium]